MIQSRRLTPIFLNFFADDMTCGRVGQKLTALFRESCLKTPHFETLGGILVKSNQGFMYLLS